eukprot:g1262.t1
MLIVPSVLLAKRLYWCCPFIPYIWKTNGVLGKYMRIAFEASYCINVLKRLYTLPLRQKLPDFYIVGFPKAGTTTLANHLKRHLAIDSISGLPWHETLSKESHYFNGVFGSSQCASATLYRSFFPTFFRRWWVEVVLRQQKWLCFDACPVPACLPFAAERIAQLTPNAKIIFMLRDPVAGVFSAEMMLRNLGVPLPWSLVEEARETDPRFMELREDVRIWNKLRNLSPEDPLPEEFPEYFYNHIHSYLQSGKYAERIEPFLQHFPRDNLMFVDFKELIKNTSETVTQVLEFVGADPNVYDFKQLPPGMKILELKRPPPMPPISELARPEAKLAGIKIDGGAFSRSRMSYYTDLSLVDIDQIVPAPEEQKQKFQNMPENRWLNSVSYSPQGTKLAFTVRSPGGPEDPPRTASELWTVDLESLVAKPVLTGSPCQLNTIFQDYTWIDEDTIVAFCLPNGSRTPPVQPVAPASPIIQDNSQAKIAQAYTYQDLLQDEYDEDLFEFYCTSELVVIDLVTGQEVHRSIPRIYTSVSKSPNSQYLLVSWLERPFSFVVPCGRFPKRVEIWNRDLTLFQEFTYLPLAEDIPIEFSSVRKGPRKIRWRPDKDSNLCWIEAQDEGDPKNDVSPRDLVYGMEISPSIPHKPTVLASTELRCYGVSFCDGNLALLYESWWNDRRSVTSVFSPDEPNQPAKVLFDRSFEDVYNDPGQPIARRTARGTYVLAKINGERKLLLNGEGASPKGNQPFLDVLNVDSGQTERIWQSSAPHYESFVSILTDVEDQEISIPGMKIMISKETNQEVPQYYSLTFDTTPELRLMTKFPHPYPHMKDVKKEIIKYKRKDGIDLSGTLYLPVGYDQDRDGPLPCLLWAYPEEFKSKDAAGQLRKSPYEFVSLGALSPKLWLAQKYAVLDGPTMPIVAEGDEEPNDTYIEQLKDSAESTVEELKRRGIAKDGAIAIGGHSYGAFMVGNLLAHCPELFACGICRSGAYNRTLTPFGFQAEQRTFWKATETYIKMSPFASADKIKKPVLLIHGKDDNNIGTHTMQSERFYAALKGHGAPCRLVLLPHEGHGYRAEQSVLHCLYEMNNWLEQYCT